MPVIAILAILQLNRQSPVKRYRSELRFLPELEHSHPVEDDALGFHG